MRRYGIAPLTTISAGSEFLASFDMRLVLPSVSGLAAVDDGDVVPPGPAIPCDGIAWKAGASVDISGLSGFVGTGQERSLALDHSTDPPQWVMIGYETSRPDDSYEYITFDQDTVSTPSSTALFTNTNASNEILQTIRITPQGYILTAVPTLSVPDYGVDLFNSNGSVLFNWSPTTPEDVKTNATTGPAIDIQSTASGTWVAAWASFYNPAGTLNDVDRLYVHLQGESTPEMLYEIDAEDDGDIIGVQVAVDTVLDEYYVFFIINPTPAGVNQLWYIKYSGGSWGTEQDITSVLDGSLSTSWAPQRRYWSVSARNGVVAFSITEIGETAGFYYSVDGAATWSSRIDPFDLVTGTKDGDAVDLNFSPDGKFLAVVAPHLGTHDEIFAFVYERDDPLTGLFIQNVYPLTATADDPETVTGSHDFYFEIADDGEVYAAWGTASDIHQAICIPGPTTETSYSALVTEYQNNYGALIAYYKLHDGDELVDSGPNALTLTNPVNLLSQSGPYSTTDRVAGDTDAVSSIQMPYLFADNGLNGNRSGFTIMFWVYPDSSTTKTTRQIFQLMQQFDEYGLRVYLKNDTDLICFFKAKPTWLSLTFNGPSITQDAWHFVSIRVDMLRDTVYWRVDDVEQETTEDLSPDIAWGTQTNVPNRLLSYHGFGGDLWHGGGLSDLVFIERPISDEWIAAFAATTQP